MDGEKILGLWGFVILFYLFIKVEGCEVYEEVKYLNGGKAFDPNGLSMALFQTCLEVLIEDFMKVFHDFHGKVSLLEA